MGELPMADGYQNRRHNRFSTVTNVLVRELGAFTWRHGKVSDIGLGGVSAIFENPFSAKMQVELEFYTTDLHGDAKKRRLTGVVMWRRARKNGIQFHVTARKKTPAKKKIVRKKT
jgi:hypothetical protein